jgi:ATP-dependent Clp protease adaptor protein ClpS
MGWSHSIYSTYNPPISDSLLPISGGCKNFGWSGRLADSKMEMMGGRQTIYSAALLAAKGEETGPAPEPVAKPSPEADESATATKAMPTPSKSPLRKAGRQPARPQQLPPYNVVLLNDNDHTYAYVVGMLGSIFGHPRTQAYKMAQEVDQSGRVIVWTTHRELAELKRDQIHAFGTDNAVATCSGSMSALIEPAN